MNNKTIKTEFEKNKMVYSFFSDSGEVEIDKKHRAKIEGEIREDLKKVSSIRSIVEAISEGKIRHLSIKY